MTDTPAGTPGDASPEGGRELPLFPLGTVLFPGGTLPLQIFEPRYLDLVKRCMREDAPFGVVLLREGAEAGRADAPPAIAPVGTEARIVDFTQLSNGLLGITSRGGPRFRVRRHRVADDGLIIGEVETLPEPAPLAVPEEYGALLEILRQLLEHPVVNRLGVEVDWDDARSVAGRLADLLPITPGLKQALLELDDPLMRLVELERVVQAMQEEEAAD